MQIIPALFLPLEPDVVMRFPGVLDALGLPGSWGSLSRLMNPVIDVLVADAGLQPEVVNFLVSWFSWGLGEKEWSSKNSVFILGPNCNALKPFDWKIQAPGRMFNAYEKNFSFLFFFSHLYWRIHALPCRVSFCCTTKWISYMYTYVPISPPSFAHSHMLLNQLVLWSHEHRCSQASKWNPFEPHHCRVPKQSDTFL